MASTQSKNQNAFRVGFKTRGIRKVTDRYAVIIAVDDGEKILGINGKTDWRAISDDLLLFLIVENLIDHNCSAKNGDVVFTVDDVNSVGVCPREK